MQNFLKAYTIKKIEDLETNVVYIYDDVDDDDGAGPEFIY